MPAVTVPAATFSETTSAPRLDAYLAVPATGEGPWPAVVVLHEAFGLNDDIRQQADRLAAAGYLAVAPDLFTAGGVRRCIRATLAALRSGKGDAFEDISAVRRWVAGRKDCTGRVGVIGFCMGGGFALLTASQGFAAAAPNYGILPDDLDEALRGACPVVASYGGRDLLLKGATRRLEGALRRAGVEHDAREYDRAGHSFLNRLNAGPFGPLLKVAGIGYHHPSAEDAWYRILRFFETHLRETPPEKPETSPNPD